MNRAILLAGTVVLLVDLAVAGQRQLTLSEAERLARAALSEETKRLPGLSLEPPPIPPENGAMFDVVWSNPAPGSVHIRFLLVDIDTGEVWDPVRCEPVTTRALETSQRGIRRQLKISAAEVNSARTNAKKNGCSNLVDERPKAADFHPARLGGISINENRTLHRYSIIVGGDQLYIGYSPVPIKIIEGAEIKISWTKTSMFVIDDEGSIQVLRDEAALRVLRPRPKR